MIKRALRWTLLGTAMLLACAGHGGKDSEHPSYSVTQKVADKLNRFDALAKKKDWDGASAVLDEVGRSENLNPYERALVWLSRARVHLAQSKSEDVAKDLEQAVALDAMPEQQQRDATYNLAQAYFVLERFSQAADTFAKWEAHEPSPKPEQLYVIASSFAQAKRFEEALPRAEKAAAGMKPQPTEPVLSFLVSVYYELDRQEDVAKTLERLTELYPKNKEWWLQLAATYDVLHQPERALSALQGAYEKGFLTEEKELLALASAYNRNGKPAEGAALIEQQMKDGKVSRGQAALLMLAQCWLAAKDAARAEAAIADAGDALTSGEPYVELARLEIANGQWTKARDALASAFAKGGLSSPGEAHLLLGVAHYRTKRKDAALASLTEAKRSPPTQRCAEVWLQVVRTGKEGADAGCLHELEQP